LEIERKEVLVLSTLESGHGTIKYSAERDFAEGRYSRI